MPTTYSQPTNLDLVVAILGKVMRKWHQKLADADVRVGILFASNADSSPLKHGGYPVAARIRVVSLMWRVLTGIDALIEIDEHVWQELEDDSKVALLDHELSHIETVEEESPQGGIIVKRDDLGRPKLQTRDGDWNGGDGFIAVVKRHTEAALEVVNSRRVHRIVSAAVQEGFDEQFKEPFEGAK